MKLLDTYDKAKIALIREFYLRVYKNNMNDMDYYILGDTIAINDEFWQMSDIYDTLVNNWNPEYVYKWNIYCIDCHFAEEERGDHELYHVSLAYFISTYKGEDLDDYRNSYIQSRKDNEIRINTPEYKEEEKKIMQGIRDKYLLNIK